MIEYKYNKEELDITDVIKYFLSKKRMVIALITTFFICGLLYSIFATPYFKASISIYPSSNNSTLDNPVGDLKGLATSFGINVNAAAGSNIYIPDIVKSNRLLKSVVTKKWQIENKSKPVNLIEFWEIDKPSPLILVLKFFGMRKTLTAEQLLYKQKLIAIEKLRLNLEVSESNSGLITISLLSEEKDLAALIVNYIVEFIIDYLSNELTIQETKNRIFISNQLEDAKADLSQSEIELMKFQKEHTLMEDSPEIQLVRGRLLRNVEVNQEVYITLRQQFEIARINELKEIPFINILDIGEPPKEKEKPKRLLILVLSLILGFILASVAVLISYLIRELNLHAKKD